MRILDVATLASGATNEDRAGASGNLAWVIDGATDVIDEPLTGFPSDASWIAEEIDRQLRSLALAPGADLAQLPAILAERLQGAFSQIAKRHPLARDEHPSASGLIVRVENERLEYVAVGDCSLIVPTLDGVTRISVDEVTAGDPWVANAIRNIQGGSSDIRQSEVRAALWPVLRMARSAMNEIDGYGVLSLTSPPAQFVTHGWVDVDVGSKILLATDGLMRLVDVFHRYTVPTLLGAACQHGLASLLTEVRALEGADAECRLFLRAKCSDDATGLLLEV